MTQQERTYNNTTYNKTAQTQHKIMHINTHTDIK